MTVLESIFFNKSVVKVRDGVTLQKTLLLRPSVGTGRGVFLWAEADDLCGEHNTN